MIPIVKADGVSEQQLLSSLRSRAGEVDKKVTESVSEILDRVRREGDAAVQYYTEKFDGRLPPAFEVSREEINDALTEADPAFVEALLNAQANITAFHNRQKRESFIDPHPDGVILGQRIRGLHRVGLYVPGGTAAYPSSVLMNAIPAKIAGVGEIIMVTPPLKDGRANPDILVAAAICGVDQVFLMGGAQAVAALAYGTETVPRVDKIVGPGNIYVATAKKLLYGTVDIDMIAGPSEILVLADESADPVYVAADLMSQAEHDRLASAILITTSEKLAEETVKELSRQMEHLSRKEIIDESLDQLRRHHRLRRYGRPLSPWPTRLPPNISSCRWTTPSSTSAGSTTPVRSLWATFRRNRWGTITPARTMSCRPAAPPGSSLRCRSTPLSKKSSFIYYTEGRAGGGERRYRHPRRERGPDRPRRRHQGPFSRRSWKE